MDFKIPKTIYQTYKTLYLNVDMMKATQVWRRLNPEYNYMLYDDNMCRKFLKDNFKPEVLKAFDKIIPGAFKADLWRCCMLYVNGGVYADIDMIPIIPLREIVLKDDEFICIKDRCTTGIHNAFIASIPKHPLLKHVIDLCVIHILNEYYGKDVLSVTGPLAFGLAFNIYLNRSVKTCFTEGIHCKEIKKIYHGDPGKKHYFWIYSRHKKLLNPCWDTHTDPGRHCNNYGRINNKIYQCLGHDEPFNLKYKVLTLNKHDKTEFKGRILIKSKYKGYVTPHNYARLWFSGRIYNI